MKIHSVSACHWMNAYIMEFAVKACTFMFGNVFLKVTLVPILSKKPALKNVL